MRFLSELNSTGVNRRRILRAPLWSVNQPQAPGRVRITRAQRTPQRAGPWPRAAPRAAGANASGYRPFEGKNSASAASRTLLDEYVLDGSSDTIAGHAGDDLLRGGNGDDRFIVQGTDRISGGRGDDRAAITPWSSVGKRSGLESEYMDPNYGASLLGHDDASGLFVLVTRAVFRPCSIRF